MHQFLAAPHLQEAFLAADAGTQLNCAAHPSPTARIDGMETISLALSMLAAVIVSAVLVRAIPIAIPTPLVQIALGAAIASVSHREVQLDPEIFFLLFLPPLLFLDGWRISKEGLLRDRVMILELALGLVFCTVICMGFFFTG